jgi:hypothetical protein
MVSLTGTLRAGRVPFNSIQDAFRFKLKALAKPFSAPTYWRAGRPSACPFCILQTSSRWAFYKNKKLLKPSKYLFFMHSCMAWGWACGWWKASQSPKARNTHIQRLLPLKCS